MDHYCVEVVRKLAVISKRILYLVLKLQNSRLNFNAALLDCLLVLVTHFDGFG